MNPLNHPGGYQVPENDVEKRGELKDASINVTLAGSDSLEQHDIPPTPTVLKGRLARWNDKMEGLGGLEARGISRVLPEEKHDMGVMGYLQMFSLWFSINLVAIYAVTGLLGPLLFNLGWVDCICCVIFANALSCCGAAYTATFGPQSGNRTMVRLRAAEYSQPCHTYHFSFKGNYSGANVLSRLIIYTGMLAQLAMGLQLILPLDPRSLLYGLLALQDHLRLQHP